MQACIMPVATLTPAQQAQDTQICQNEYNQSVTYWNGIEQNDKNSYNQTLATEGPIINYGQVSGMTGSYYTNAQKDLDQAQAILNTEEANIQSALANAKSTLQTCLNNIVLNIVLTP